MEFSRNIGAVARVIDAKALEDIEDWHLGARMYELSKSTKFVSEESIFKLINDKLAEQ
jgi:hypothetical protein